MKKRLVIIISIIITVLFTSYGYANNKFEDINGHWAEKIINEMNTRRIVKGVDAQHFMPDSDIKRAEFIVLLHRILGVEINYFAAPNIEELFDDTKNSDWFSIVLYDMYSVGIVDDQNSFRPNEKITREEAIYYLVRSYNYAVRNDINEVESAKPDSPNYINVKDIKFAGERYVDYIITAYQLSLVQGRDDISFVPNGALTRAEALIVMKRIENAIINYENKIISSTATYEYTDDGIEIVFDILNNTNSPKVITFNSGQRYNLILLDKDNEVVYNWASDKMFVQAIQFIELGAKESIQFTETLEFEKYRELIDKTESIVVQLVGKIGGEVLEDIVLTIEK